MEYIISFLEGIITFISPCMLPMLPIYISYFSGSSSAETKKNKALINAIGFVLGFTIVFIILGAFSGTIGRFLMVYSKAFNIVFGIIIILFGLNFMGVLKLPFINNLTQHNKNIGVNGFFSSVLFGIIFSVSWTPCVGAFLGSALMLAAQGGETFKGIMMLLSFSLGLGIPFIASAVLINRLKSTFDFIKRNYRIINIISGGLLVIIGILMATGLLGYFFSILTF
ncbi:MAG: cytochrome c biogenesis CcdA family protein [Eubacteriales bacterium]